VRAELVAGDGLAGAEVVLEPFADLLQVAGQQPGYLPAAVLGPGRDDGPDGDRQAAAHGAYRLNAPGDPERGAILHRTEQVVAPAFVPAGELAFEHGPAVVVDRIPRADPRPAFDLVPLAERMVLRQALRIGDHIPDPPPGFWHHDDMAGGLPQPLVFDGFIHAGCPEQSDVWKRIPRHPATAEQIPLHPQDFAP